MKTTLTHISRISSRLMGSTGTRKIPIPSPKALLLALILGPAMLMAVHSSQLGTAFADTGAETTSTAMGDPEKCWWMGLPCIVFDSD